MVTLLKLLQNKPRLSRTLFSIPFSFLPNLFLSPLILTSNVPTHPFLSFPAILLRILRISFQVFTNTCSCANSSHSFKGDQEPPTLNDRVEALFLTFQLESLENEVT